ncbi:diguanylate cyclase (GGDEF) domain-containing protein [Gracilibacillus ureilyticus]|uniref:Diguanylate cyclase (GGDEF) domain-containing protein n=1 Tax=Gracilibacillus ureilyticus TaxID=531814 RepID=A0A1H9QB21_9BACI|nr:GGDEF domain-containing phosphodiesterase [Gracilibacillus ureilyticus]SER57664.1 diguanylate cyclase (GGDEF) domain-containing protein [Gracilibacillus ureilyticus]
MINGKGMKLTSINHLFNNEQLTDKLNKLMNEDTETKREVIHGEIQEQFNSVSKLFHIIEQVVSYAIFDSEYRLVYSEKDLNKQAISTLFHSTNSFLNITKEVIENGKWQGKVYLNNSNNEKTWYNAHVFPFAQNEDKPDLFVMVLMEVSENESIMEKDAGVIQSSYTKMLQEVMNLIFKLKKIDGQMIFTFMEGKLSQKLNISKNLNEIIEQLDQDTCLLLKDKVDSAFHGEEEVFKFQFKGLHLKAMLSPLLEDGFVTEIVGTVIDISSFDYSIKQIEHIVNHDSLTDLPNRQKLMKDMELFIHNDAENKPKAVVFCDLDRLKNINDTIGQFAGDQVITMIAERIDAMIPDGSYLYRLDGDEFVIVFGRLTEDVNHLTKQILQKIRQPIVIANHEFYITATMGISYIEEFANEAEEYINRASIALHYGKVHGGNQVYEYNKQMSQTYNELLLLESDIRKAFKLNEFKLAYQPKVDVQTNRIVGVEALIRWEHGKKGKIPPSTFIPIAEEIGMIHAIGEWVLYEACRQFMRWKEAGAEPVIIAVNVSAIELQQADFLCKVKNAINETGMDPNYLEIEITENSVMQNTDACIRTMKELRKMGISLSIDDFGTGYSSMGYLQKFPINFLKIDQSFIKDLFTESGSAEIIKAMIQLGHTFGLKVVAEGVEGEQILSFIRDEDCDYYQGYFYSKPLDANEIGMKLNSLH